MAALVARLALVNPHLARGALFGLRRRRLMFRAARYCCVYGLLKPLPAVGAKFGFFAFFLFCPHVMGSPDAT
jgi:hypothetical protein